MRHSYAASSMGWQKYEAKRDCPALNKDTIFQVQNDYVAPKLAHEQRQLEILRSDAVSNPNSTHRKLIGAQESFVEELLVMLDHLKRVAPLWSVDLDDGVVINFAPLWRLVPQHKPWQTVLKSHWDDLVAGKFDWTSLAMHLWPERVVAKCGTERSLAIAHGLQDVLWVEEKDGKWRPRTESTRLIGELVSERTSVAVKTALNGLAEATVPAAPITSTRRSSS